MWRYLNFAQASSRIRERTCSCVKGSAEVELFCYTELHNLLLAWDSACQRGYTVLNSTATMFVVSFVSIDDA